MVYYWVANFDVGGPMIILITKKWVTKSKSKAEMSIARCHSHSQASQKIVTRFSQLTTDVTVKSRMRLGSEYQW